MSGKIKYLNYKKSIRVVYTPSGCYTICDGDIKYYPSLESLQRNIDVDIKERNFGNNYWGCIKPSNDMQYGYIDNNRLYFTNRFGVITGDYFDCYQINKFLNLRSFESDFNSGNLQNLNLKLYTEQMPGEKWKISTLYSMVESANKYLQSKYSYNGFSLRLDIRNFGEFENSPSEKSRYIEKEVGGQFTPFIRLWVNNGVNTGMYKFNYFIDGMNASLYRKVEKIGNLLDLVDKYSITLPVTDPAFKRNLEYNLRHNNEIARFSKIAITDDIVSEIKIDNFFPLLNQYRFNNFFETCAKNLIYQLGIENNYILADVPMQARSYDVFYNADFGSIATVKVVDSYTCRESTIRFIENDNKFIEGSIEALKNDLESGNIEIYLAHYTDVVNRDHYFRKHIDTVYDELGNRVSGYKEKAKQLDVKDKFYNCSLGIKEFVASTHRMEPKAFVIASTVDKWNYLNDNIFSVRGVVCELRDFTGVNGIEENNGSSVYPCVTVGLNIDEHSINYGEIVEVYYINKRTGSFKSCVLSTPRYITASVKGSNRKKMNTSNLYGFQNSKPVNNKK